MSLTYSVFTVMMPEFDVPESARLLKELGYDGVEWRVHNVPSIFPDQPDFWRGNRATIDIETIVHKAQEIRRICDDAGIQIMGWARMWATSCWMTWRNAWKRRS